MLSEQLKKIFKLIKKTNDPVVIYDSQVPDDSYVLLTLDSYTNLIADKKILSPNSNTDKLNHADKISPETSLKKDLNKVSHPESKSLVESSETEENKNLTEEYLTDKINREISELATPSEEVSSLEENHPQQAWKIPGTIKNKAEEVV